MISLPWLFPDFFYFPWFFPGHFGIPWLFQVFQVSGHPDYYICSEMVDQRTHTKQIVDSAVRVVETRPQGTDNLITLKAHRHNLQHSLLVCLACHQKTFGFRQRAYWVWHNRRCRCWSWSRLRGYRCGRWCRCPWRCNSLGWLRLSCFNWLFSIFWLWLHTVQCQSIFTLLNTQIVTFSNTS